MQAPLQAPGPEESGRWMHDLMRELFPICRSITGDGVRQTLHRLGKELPIEVHEVPSGTEVFDWVVPDEWNPREAWIEGPDGRRIVDFADNPLHLLNYSVPFEGEMELEELTPHLYTRPDLPDAIPYVTSYYARRWGFCLRHNDFAELPAGRYRVKIDTSLEPGSLTYGEAVIPGDSREEVLLSTYVCHPSMANNELSGPVLTTLLGRHLQALPRRRYTYRLVFVPETIGSITYLSRNLEHLRRHLVAGYVVSCVGGPGTPTYIRTRDGTRLADKVAAHVLDHWDEDSRILDFSQSSSDERRYNAPGVDLPVGSLLRTRYFDYPEYHTSLDDLSFVTPSQLAASFELYRRLVEVLENNRRYRITTLCEPNLGRRGLFPTLGAPAQLEEEVEALMALCSYCDGKNDLIDIARLHNRFVSVYYDPIEGMSEAGLLAPVEGPAEPEGEAE